MQPSPTSWTFDNWDIDYSVIVSGRCNDCNGSYLWPKYSMYQSNFGNMYKRNVSPLRFWRLPNADVGCGLETDETIYHPHSQQLPHTSAPPPGIQVLALSQYNTKTFTNFLQSKFQIASHISNAASHFTKERLGNCKDG